MRQQQELEQQQQQQQSWGRQREEGGAGETDDHLQYQEVSTSCATPAQQSSSLPLTALSRQIFCDTRGLLQYIVTTL